MTIEDFAYRDSTLNKYSFDDTAYIPADFRNQDMVNESELLIPFVFAKELYKSVEQSTEQSDATISWVRAVSLLPRLVWQYTFEMQNQAHSMLKRHAIANIQEHRE